MGRSLGTSEVVTVTAGTPVTEVAEVLANQGVGCVVVLSDEGKPLGLLTDRDLVTRVLATGREYGSTPAASVMTRPLLSVGRDASLEQVLDLMAEHGVRRVPVVEDGEICGLVALDDALLALGDDLRALGEIPRREIRSAHRAARARELRDDVERLVQRGLGEAERLGGKASAALTREFESVRDRLKKLFD